MADSGVPGCTVAGNQYARYAAAYTHTRRSGSCGNDYNTHTHRQTPGNNERSEIRPDINCAHRVWRCYGCCCCCCCCIRAGEGTGRYRLTPILRRDMCDIRYKNERSADLTLPAVPRSPCPISPRPPSRKKKTRARIFQEIIQGMLIYRYIYTLIYRRLYILVSAKSIQ